MERVEVTCSRCSTAIAGAYTGDGWTSGYYDVRDGTPWAMFAKHDETDLCDPCMWADPRYASIYSSDSQANTWRNSRGAGGDG